MSVFVFVVLSYLLLYQFTICECGSNVLNNRLRCRTDIDCPANAFCFGNDFNTFGHCKCQNGYEYFSEGKVFECLEIKRLGETCKRDMQCQIFSGPLTICADVDSKRICTCNSTISHRFENTCYETRLLDQFCRTDENCLLPESLVGEEKHAICSFGVCSCPLGTRPSPSKKRCIKSTKMGEICENDLQCQGTENSVCRRICTCETGYIESSDGSKCLKAALKFDENCTENQQCSTFLEGGLCIGQICTCPAHFHEYGTKCRRDAKPDENCFDAGDCIIFKELMELVNCTKGVCVCVNGRSFDERICLPNNSFSISGNHLFTIISIIMLFITNTVHHKESCS